MARPIATRDAKVTQTTIARQLGMSKSTVSMILSGHPHAQRYSVETRRRVLDSARQLQYRPDYFASQLRKESRKIIMLCVSTLNDSYAAGIAQAFGSRATRRGYQMLVSALANHNDDRALFGDIVGAHGVSALAIVGSSTQQWLSDELVTDLAARGVQVVLVGREIDADGIAQVVIDNASAERQAARYLYEQGVNRICYVHGPATTQAYQQRQAGAIACSAELGKPEPDRVFVTESSVPEGRKRMLAYLDEHECPDAVLADGDKRAIGALQGLREAGYDVGRDVAVIGFDDIEMAGMITPTLTTVRVPRDQMGETACDLLIDLYEGELYPTRKIVLPAPLIERESGRFNPHRRNGYRGS